jgi:hypothetical protein
VTPCSGTGWTGRRGSRRARLVRPSHRGQAVRWRPRLPRQRLLAFLVQGAHLRGAHLLGGCPRSPSFERLPRLAVVTSSMAVRLPNRCPGSRGWHPSQVVPTARAWAGMAMAHCRGGTFQSRLACRRRVARCCRRKCRCRRLRRGFCPSGRGWEVCSSNAVQGSRSARSLAVPDARDREARTREALRHCRGRDPPSQASRYWHWPDPAS